MSSPSDRAASLAMISSQAVLRSHIEPTQDITEERAKATFDVAELSHVLAGGKDQLELRWEPFTPYMGERQVSIQSLWE